MNVAALLHDAPSDDHKRRQQQRDQQQQQRQPSPDRERERQHPPPNPQPPAQQRHSQPSQPPHHSPPPPFYHQPPPRHARPPSPPRSYSQESGSHSQNQRLPPPSAIMGMADPYDIRHRRQEPEPLSMHHEMALRGHHPPPPGVPSTPYTLDRNPARSQPPPHSQHHHSHSSAPSPMYVPPPPSGSRSIHSMPATPKHANSPPTHNSGPVPLYPTPVGPGMGPPSGPPPSSHAHMDSRGSSLGYNEPSVMYSGHHAIHAPPGASIMGALPPPPPASTHPHHSRSQSQSSSHNPPTHRRTGSGGDRYGRDGGSPAMSSLQRPIPGTYDERERIDRERERERDREGGPSGRALGPQGPSPQLGGSMPPGASASSSMMSMRGGPSTAMGAGGLTGPGATGLHDRQRERERERDIGMVRRELSRDERREMERERDRMERHEKRDIGRTMEERMREREREFTMDEVEREREWARNRQGQAPLQTPTRTEAQVWSRFNNNPYPKMFDEARDREAEARERDRVREAFPSVEDIRMREEWEERERYAKQIAMGRQPGRERDAREKERDSDRDGRRDRPKEPRRTSKDEHGWLPEPRGPDTWPKESERDKEMRERERIYRERDRERELMREDNDPLRSSRQYPPNLHHHHLHHRHGPPSQSQIMSSKTTKAIRPTDLGEMAMAPSGMVNIPPGGMPPPFAPPMAERPSQHGSALHKSKVANGLIAPAPGQPSISQMSQHVHPHMYGLPHGPPVGFPHRRGSPPPFMNPLAHNMFIPPPHSPKQPLPPALPPLHLGTFVYPRTPFPFLDFPAPSSPDSLTASGQLMSNGHLSNGQVSLAEKEAKDAREIRATILIPSGFLPSKRPQRPQIWGGWPIPSFTPLFASPPLASHMQSGMPYQFRRYHPSELQGYRRVYTDDSDLFLCALHAGWIKWSHTTNARNEGMDLKVEVRLTREARYIGGFGSHYVGGAEEDDLIGSDDDDGRSLLSASWGNSHDGAGLEILNAAFVKKGTAHALTIRNREQRLLEYTDRHFVLTCTRQSRKRRRVLYQTIKDEYLTDVEHLDAQLCSSRTIVLGGRVGWSHAGFEYNPDSLKGTLFPDHQTGTPGAKHSSDSLTMDIDEPVDTAAGDRVSDVKQPPSVFVHTSSETFLIYPQNKASPSPPSSDDKENTQDAVGSWRYAIALVAQAPPAAMQRPSDVSASTPVDAPAPPTSAPTEAPEAAKDAASSEGSVVDMSMSPSESSKPSVNGDAAEPGTEIGPSAAQDKTTDVTESGNKDGKQEKTVSTEEASSLVRNSEDGVAKGPNETKKEPEPKPAAADKLADVQPAPSKAGEVQTARSNESVPKKPPTLQVLQRDLSAEQFVFDADGVGVVGEAVENGARKGWKIEVTSWRLAGADALPLIQTVL